MPRTDVLIIGAGQAGLAMSHCLKARGIGHVLIERGRIAESWRSERWDSLRLLTPNWMTRLPGHRYAGPDPHGFLAAAEVAALLDGYAGSFGAPVVGGTRVRALAMAGGGYLARDRPRRLARPRRGGGDRCLRAAAAAGLRRGAPVRHRPGRRGSLPAAGRSCPPAACWWSAARRPGCSSRRRSTARAAR